MPIRAAHHRAAPPSWRCGRRRRSTGPPVGRQRAQRVLADHLPAGAGRGRPQRPTCGNSATVRPRLSHTPRTTRRRPAASSSGSARRRLASATRETGSSGPIAARHRAADVGRTQPAAARGTARSAARAAAASSRNASVRHRHPRQQGVQRRLVRPGERHADHGDLRPPARRQAGGVLRRGDQRGAQPVRAPSEPAQFGGACRGDGRRKARCPPPRAPAAASVAKNFPGGRCRRRRTRGGRPGAARPAGAGRRAARAGRTAGGRAHRQRPRRSARPPGSGRRRRPPARAAARPAARARCRTRMRRR